MKLKTILKIAFCVVLLVAVVFSVFRVRMGANHLDAEVVSVHNADFLDRMVDDWESNAYIADGFSMGRDTFYRKTIVSYDAFYAQHTKLEVKNDRDFDIRVLGLEILEGEGTRSIFISTLPVKTVVVPAGTTEPKPVLFPTISGGASNEDVRDELRTHFALKIIYVDASTGITSLSDAPKDALYKEWIRK